MFDFLKEAKIIRESKAFRNEGDIEHYSKKELCEIGYCMLLTLELLSQTRYSNDIHKYALNSLSYPRFDRIYLSNTDLANVISTLYNARTYLEQPDVDIPLLEFKRYLRDCHGTTMDSATRRSFFYKMQNRMKVTDSTLTNFRREIVDTDDLEFDDKIRIGHRLYNQLRKYEYKCDILILLQKFMDNHAE
jgi:hypothetical protein